MSLVANIVEHAQSIARAGTAAALALSIGTAHDAANRIGAYADVTAAAEKLTLVVGGVTGPSFDRTGAQVIATALTVEDASFAISDNADPTKTLAFQCGSLTSGFGLTIDVGAQGANRVLSVPVLTANATLATLEENQTFSGNNLFTGPTSVAPSADQVQIGGGCVSAYNSAGDSFRALNTAGTTARFVVGAVDASDANGRLLVAWSDSTNTGSINSYKAGAYRALTLDASSFTFGQGPVTVTDTSSSTTASLNAIYTPGGFGVGGVAVINGTIYIGSSSGNVQTPSHTGAGDAMNFKMWNGSTDVTGLSLVKNVGGTIDTNVTTLTATQVTGTGLQVDSTDPAAISCNGGGLFDGPLRVRSAAIGAIGVATASETAPDSIVAWDATKHSILCGPASATSSGALAASYDQTSNIASLIALAPGTAWQEIRFHANNYQWKTSGTSRMTLSNSGILTLPTILDDALTCAGGGLFGTQVLVQRAAGTPVIAIEQTGGGSAAASMYFLGGSAAGQSYFGFRNQFNIGTTASVGGAISTIAYFTSTKLTLNTLMTGGLDIQAPTGTTLVIGSSDAAAIACAGGIITGNNTALAKVAGAVGWVSIGDNGTGAGALRLFGGSTQVGWQIGSNITTANALEFTPATAGGGTTFTSPVMKLTNTGTIVLSDAVNIVVDTTTGTKIGTAAGQKLSLWGVTPVVQPATTGTTAGFTAGTGTGMNDDSTSTGGVGSSAYTFGDVVLALKQLGGLAV